MSYFLGLFVVVTQGCWWHCGQLIAWEGGRPWPCVSSSSPCALFRCMAVLAGRIHSSRPELKPKNRPASRLYLSCRASMTVLIFIARAFIAGGFQAAYVYTPEVRDPVRMQAPVQIRKPIAFIRISAGVSNGDQGFGSGNKQRNGKSRCPHYTFCCAGKDSGRPLSLNSSQRKRCGCSSAGLLLKVMLESSVYLALSVYCCCCLFAAIASCALPIETTGRALQESSQREWGQEMVGRASSHGSVRMPHSSSGSQGWPQLEFTWRLTTTKGRKKKPQTGFLCPSSVPS